MKNMKTHLTRLLVIFSSLVMLLSTVVALPISADAPGDAPILAETEYGITYDNGVYTININAERLAELLASPSFNKETLESIMPATVYDLIVNQNSEAASELIADLIENTNYGELKDDLPIDILKEHFSTEDIMNVVSVDELLKVIDINAIISSLSAEELENIFKEGALEELLESVDLSGVLTSENIKAVMKELTAEEINAALKEGAIEKLINDGVIDLSALLQDQTLVDKLLDKSNGIITDADISALVKDEALVNKVLEDNVVLKQILNNKNFMKKIANDPNIVSVLMNDKGIVQLFIDKDLVHYFYDVLTAEQLKSIVITKDIDISGLITPEVLSKLSADVIKEVISTDDIKKLADKIDTATLRQIVKDNDCIDVSRIQFSHIYPTYITAEEIKNANVITADELKTLASKLTAQQKTEISEGVDFSKVEFSKIYKADGTGYITDAMIKETGVISESDIDDLISLLDPAEKLEIMANYGSDLSNINFSVFYNYLTEDEVRNAHVFSDDDFSKLAAKVSDDDKITIAIDNSLINIATVAGYFSASDIKSVIDQTDLDKLEALLTDEEKLTIAVDNKYIDFAKINFADLKQHITTADIKNTGIITKEDLQKIDAQVFKDAGLNAKDIFTELKNQGKDPAQLIIDLYKDGSIPTKDIKFDQIIEDISKDSDAMTAIVDAAMSSSSIISIATDVVLSDVSILTNAISPAELYKRGIITKAMIFGGTDKDSGVTYPGIITSTDIQTILDKEIISVDALFNSITDTQALLEQINISALPMEKIRKVIDIGELVDLILEQNRQGLIEALDIRYLLSLESVQTELRSLTAGEIKAIINTDAIKNELLFKVLLLPNRFENIFINQTPILVDGCFNISKIEYAVLDALPTFDKIANVGEDGIISELVVAASANGEGYYFGFKIKLVGDTTDIKEYAQKIVDKFSFVVEADGTINTTINLPEQIADLYITAIDNDKVPEVIKNKLKDAANFEFNKSDIGDLREEIINKLSISEIKDLLSSVNVANLNAKLLDQLDMRKSEAQIILDYAINAIDKATSILENSPEIDSILATFNDKKLSEFYTGNGTFEIGIDYFYDPVEILEKKYELPETVKSFLTGTRIEHHTNTVITFEGLYSATFKLDGDTVYTAFRTEGYDINKITNRPAFAGIKDDNGWGGADAEAIATMPAADVELAKINLATFTTKYANGTRVEDYVIPFTELSNTDELVKVPENIDKQHYTLTWESFTVTNDDFTVLGTYTPIEYSVTFKGHNYEETFTYNVENKDSFAAPAVPAKEHYDGKWSDFELDFSEDLVVEAVYVPTTYSIIFRAEGSSDITVEYDIENPFNAANAPSVPERPGYNGVWETYEPLFQKGQVVNAIYTSVDDPIQWYTIRFLDENNNIYKTISYSINTPESDFTPPSTIPTKEGYTVSWPEFKNEIFSNGVIVNPHSFDVRAEYQAITYTATFHYLNPETGAEGSVVLNYTVEDIRNGTVSIPSFPAAAVQKGYNVAWAISDINNLPLSNTTVELNYTLIQYYITFEDVNATYTYYFTIKDQSAVTPPAPYAERGYDAAWGSYTILNESIFADTDSYNQIVTEKIYIAREYVINFVDENGKVFGSASFHKDMTPEALAQIKSPEELPIKEGYKVSWPAFVLFDDNRYDANGYSYDLNVVAVYEKINYTANFSYTLPGTTTEIFFGNTLTYTIDDSGELVLPAIPEEAQIPGYIASWQTYTWFPAYESSAALYSLRRTSTAPSKEFTISIVYTPINYTITFVDEAGNVISTGTFNKKDHAEGSIIAPNFSKLHYTITWPAFELYSNERYNETGSYDLTVQAIETPISYYVTFEDWDGNQLGQIEFNIETDLNTIYPTLFPNKPSCTGYTVAWDMDYDSVMEALRDIDWTQDGDFDITVTADRTIITYTAKFWLSGNEFLAKEFNVNTIGDVAFPALPTAPRGYKYDWSIKPEDLPLSDIDITIQHSLIPYEITFVVSDTEKETFTFNVETDPSTIVPTILPEQRGYSFKWIYELFDDEYFDANDGTYSREITATRTIITYYATFIYLDGSKNEIPFTVENAATFVAPSVPERVGYTGYWRSYTLLDDDRFESEGTYSFEVNVLYSAKQYIATFYVDGKLHQAGIFFTVESDSIPEPSIPEKPGYTAAWSEYTLGAGDIRIDAIYTPITYTATFKVNGETVKVVTFTIEDTDLEEPFIPEKPGYTSKWSNYFIDAKDLTIEAVYTPITYTVTFIADGTVVATQTYTVENTSITAPAVPTKQGYTGAWEAYELTMGNVTVNAVYTEIPVEETHYIIFTDANGNVIQKIPFTSETDPSTIVLPEPPAKEGYKVYWPDITFGSSSTTIAPIYELIQYTATFKVDGQIVANLPFNVETESLTLPSLPTKPGYTAAWSEHAIGAGDMIVEAVYTPITYSVTFMADGNVVAVLYYTVENPSIEEPAVPAKSGFTGAWESYTNDIGDKVVNAVYTAEDVIDDVVPGDDDSLKESRIFWGVALIPLVASGIAIGVIYIMGKKKFFRTK